MGHDEAGHAEWRKLLAELVDENGGEDRIASRFCAAAGRRTETSFQSAKRSISNWLSGAAVPQRRNFSLLTQALDIRDEQRLKQWRALYVEARDRRQPPEAEQEESPAERPAFRAADFGRPLSLAVTAAVAAVVAALVGYYMLPAVGDDSRTIGYLPFAELKVGESVLVHAKRGECGKPPPEWHEIEHEIPVLATGRLVDDGLGTSRSTTCGGLTPGRLVRFEAQQPGEEVFDLFQRKIKVVVHP